MHNDLDPLLNHLRDQPADRRLDQLEPAVWLRIHALHAVAARGGVWGWRAALAAAMLTIGVFAGHQVTAPIAKEVSPFEINLALAPSTLLAPGS